MRIPHYKFNTNKKDEFFRNYRIDKIANQVGITKNYMSIIINGKRSVNEYLAKDIMRVIGYSKSEIRNDFDKYFIKEV